MSERHQQLCREAIEHPSKLLRSEWTDFSNEHSPELILALWECIEWQGNDDDDFYRCPICDTVETKPRHLKDSACPVRRVEALISPEETESRD